MYRDELHRSCQPKLLARCVFRAAKGSKGRGRRERGIEGKGKEGQTCRRGEVNVNVNTNANARRRSKVAIQLDLAMRRNCNELK